LKRNTYCWHWCCNTALGFNEEKDKVESSLRLPRLSWLVKIASAPLMVLSHSLQWHA
jgi:hypothetical protein